MVQQAGTPRARSRRRTAGAREAAGPAAAAESAAPADAEPKAGADPVEDTDAADAQVRTRLQRRYQVQRILGALGPTVRALLVIGALVLVLLLPVPKQPFSRSTYVDENALQPGQTDVTWDWGDVHYADKLSDDLLRLAQHGSDADRTAYVVGELRAAGLEPHTQQYVFHVPTRDGRAVRGINVYARSTTPHIDGREAMVLAASWRSRWKEAPRHDGGLPYTPDDGSERAVNVRGVAAVLALARRLTAVRHWSKDIIFVLSDGHLDGMQAWATGYFGQSQPQLEADEVRGVGAQIWNALALDYPSESFSSLSLLHEGRNGLLPNLDTLNAVAYVMQRHAMGLGLGLHGAPFELAALQLLSAGDLADAGVPREALRWLEEHLLGWGGVRAYLAGWYALAAQWRALLAGHPTGVHGVLHPFHVDAVTLFAEPATGPWGFYHLGQVAEGVARAFSNLLERLHHSQFFYLLLSPFRFVQVGMYLVVPLCISAALTLAGLALWNALGERRDARRAELLRALVWQSQEQLSELDAAPDAAQRLGEPLLERTTYREFCTLAAQCVPAGRPVEAAAAAYRALGRPVWRALACVAGAHVAGIAALASVLSSPLHCAKYSLIECDALMRAGSLTLLTPVGITVLALTGTDGRASALLGMCVHAFALLHAGMVASVLSLLNVAQATSMALVAFVTLYPLAPVRTSTRRQREVRALLYTVHVVLLVIVTPIGLAWLAESLADRGFSWLPPPSRAVRAVLETVDMAMWDAHILRSWTLPFLFVGYLPVLFEGMVAAMLYCWACMQGGDT